jgi:Tol biopolymer transport system component
MMRALALIGLALMLGVALALWARSDEHVDLPRLSWVATAHQLGPVSYRDPAGSISPDGRWMAYSEGRFLRVRPVNGGPTIEFPPGDAQIRNLVWSPDSATILADGGVTQASWATYDRAAATRQPLWPARSDVSSLKQLAWSPDGKTIAGVVNGREGSELWTIAADGSTAKSTRYDKRIAWPAWTPHGELACIATIDGRARVTLPCGGSPLRAQPDVDAYGPLAFSPEGATAYVSLANTAGTVDLWALSTTRGVAHRLTQFARDAYAPSVASDGSVVFKVQSYRTTVAAAPAGGGPTSPLATFQSETPSWDPTGKWIGITYGSWRRIPDDAKYPDIAQDAGIIRSDASTPASQPAEVVHESVSEDQSLCWSPNGRWIAFHSHKEQSDDIWLRAAGGDPQARRITMLGRGAEAGWPRWSANGRWLLFTGASRQTHRTVIYVVEMDQDSGAVVAPAREVGIQGPDLDVFHTEWLDDGSSLVAIGKEGPGRHVVFTVPRDGGQARLVYRFSSEHDQPGLGVSPDGKDVAFVAPASDGFFQIFRMPVAGGPAMQVTHDPSNKTQPSWSPDGQRIAFTVWNYDAQFWQLRPQ